MQQAHNHLLAPEVVHIVLRWNVDELVRNPEGFLETDVEPLFVLAVLLLSLGHQGARSDLQCGELCF